MAGLHGPLPTLRPWPRGQTRTARGRRGSLHIRRIGLSPTTPGRSPGALPDLVAHNLSKGRGPAGPRGGTVGPTPAIRRLLRPARVSVLVEALTRNLSAAPGAASASSPQGWSYYCVECLSPYARGRA